jgi:tRNA A37 threonylcarbamoyladenosine synthetase subunit TsaC/SUA5/YrdC
LSDESGNATLFGVIGMTISLKQRLLAAKERQQGMSLESVCYAFEDLAWWIEKDRAIALKILNSFVRSSVTLSLKRVNPKS